MMRKFILSICILLVLVGCNISTPQPPTQVATHIPTTLKPLMTSTPPATVTLASSPTRVITTIPTSTITPVPSPTPDLVATVMALQRPELYASYPSPDGLWRMDIDIYNCARVADGVDELAYEQLILVDLASGEEQLADEQLQYCGGLGAFGFAGRFWSPNSRFFYYTTARQGVPDGCGYWEAPLSRLDAASMETEYLGVGALSPDGSTVATWDTAEPALVIWDINNGELSRFTPIRDDLGMGPVIWAPDSHSLVYLQVESWCPVSGISYLVYVDLLGFNQSLLLESDDPTFADAEWDDSDFLSLFDENGSAWRYNLLSGDLARVP